MFMHSFRSLWTREKRIMMFVLFCSLVIILPISSGVFANTVTLQWATWGPEHVDRQLIAAFEREYPNIKIEYIGSAYNEHHEKMKLLSAAGAGADVFSIDGYYLAEFAHIGLVHPIDDILSKESDFDLDEYFPPTLADIQYQNTMYGLPYISGPQYLMYNATDIDEAGLARPDHNWDRETYTEYARSLTRSSGERVTRWGSEHFITWSWIWPWVWGAGGDVIDEENQTFLLASREGLSGLEWLDQMRTLGISGHGKVAEQTASMSAQYPNHFSFVRGEEWPFEWDVTLFPAGPGGQSQVWKGNVMAISSSTPYRDEAWTFLKFLLSPRGKGHEIYVANRRFQPQTRDAHLWDLWGENRGGHEAASLQDVALLVATNYGRPFPQLLNWHRIIMDHLEEALGLIRRDVASPAAAIEQIRGPVELLLRNE